MAKVKLPFMKFYPADYLQDTQALNLEAQGAWMKVICALHVAPTYGCQTWAREDLATYLNISEPDRLSIMIRKLKLVADVSMTDFAGETTKVEELAANITITCRRMTREEQQRKQWVKDQSAHRQRNVRKESGDCQAVYSEARSQKSDKIKNKNEPSVRSKELDPRIKTAADKVYAIDRKKFQKLAVWIKQAEKYNYLPESIALALDRFLPYARNVSEHWWPYLDKLILKAAQDISLNAHLAEHKKFKEADFSPEFSRLLRGVVADA